MSKYKVGDKVRVRSDLERHKFYSMKDGMLKNSVVDDMFKLRGKIVTIKEFSFGQYCIEECGYYWTDEMFEGLAEEQPKKRRGRRDGSFHEFDTVKHKKYGLGTVLEHDNTINVLVDYDEWHEGFWDGNKYWTVATELELVQAYIPN